MEKKVKTIWKQYFKSFSKSMKDTSFRRGVERGTNNYEIGIVEIMKKYPESPQLAHEVRLIKERSIAANKELVKEAKENFEKKGATVYLAKDAEDARRIFKEIIGENKLVVKSKSMTSEEIKLREFLREQNNEVWETDLGEFIIQLLGDRPMHIVSPSLHIPREKVAEIFTKFFKRKFNPDDVHEMVLAARNFLREKYYQADFGIIGANAVAAKDGISISLHNEGNIRFGSILQKNLIIFTGIEKIVPTFEDAMRTVFINARYSKYKIAGYYDIIGSSFDFQSRNIYLILLDNGRSKMIADPTFKEASYCLRCGACMYVCPPFKVIAGKYGGSTYVGGIGAIWTWFVEGEDAAIPALYTCMNDGSCKIHCPVDIDIPNMILKLKEKVTSE